jgi:HSP20 family protein
MLRQQPLFWWRTPAEEMAWLPPIEVFDKKDKLVVRAEVPGMKPEEIDISVSDSTLTIKGEGKSES